VIKDKSKDLIKELFALAEIGINGSNPWDIRVHDERFYRRILAEHSLGLGESYMDGWWDCDRLDEFFFRFLRSALENKVKPWKLIFEVIRSKIFNLQSKSRAFHVAEKHYNLGNDLYRAMLDKRMNYSCGYWKNARSLDEAQEAKLELICRKLNIRPGMTVLDIGCGWGAFEKYAAEKYKVKVLGLTVSKEQMELGNQLCKGLPVEIRLQDYRTVEGKYDCVISIGMMEHVGYKNYRTYMEVVNRTLKDDGIAFIHTIGRNEAITENDPWLDKYIFPNGMLPSVSQIGKAMEGLFVMEDWHSFGPDYDKTLMAWYQNFDNSWPKIKSNYDEIFYRMWKYYLLMCAGSFRARRIQLWQIVFSKKGVVGGYTSLR